jgi:hypothetical protein
MGSTHSIGTAHHCPLGPVDGAPRVLTGCSVDTTGRGLKSVLARKPFQPTELPGWHVAPKPWNNGGDVEASTRCCKELSTCYATAVPGMFFSHKYTSPTLSVVAPSFKAKTECIPLCVPGSIFTHKAINSEINSITSVYYFKSYYKILLQDQEV